MKSTSLIDILHLLLCDKKHSYEVTDIVNRQEEICYFYLENDIADGFNMEDHLRWKVILEQFKVSLELHTEPEVFDFVRKSIKFSQEFRELTEGNQERSTFIRSLF